MCPDEEPGHSRAKTGSRRREPTLCDCGDQLSKAGESTWGQGSAPARLRPPSWAVRPLAAPVLKFHSAGHPCFSDWDFESNLQRFSSFLRIV